MMFSFHQVDLLLCARALAQAVWARGCLLSPTRHETTFARIHNDVSKVVRLPSTFDSVHF